LIVYSPVINLYIEEGRVKFVDDGKETTMDPHAYGDEDNLFEDGSWNAEIIDELKPLSGDVILHNRNDFSAFSGTILEQTLKTHDIQRLIISGFLTDICVLST
jgi:nicotinamidase-related amidase